MLSLNKGFDFQSAIAQLHNCTIVEYVYRSSFYHLTFTEQNLYVSGYYYSHTLFHQSFIQYNINSRPAEVILTESNASIR